MKKFLLVFLIGTFAAVQSFADVEFRLFGSYEIPGESQYESTLGVTAGFDISPFTVRGRDQIYFSVGGGYTELEGKGGVLTEPIYEGLLALGYTCRFTDRLSASLEGLVGFWSIPEDDENSFASASGLIYGGRGMVNFHLLPELTLSAFAGYKIFSYDPEPITKHTEIGIGLKYNFSKGLFGSSSVVADKVDEIQAGPLFPVFYSRYDDHSFGSITFINNERNDINDVEVFVFIEKFMSNPNSSAKFDFVKRGDSFTADLTAFLNESILNTLSAQKADVRVIVKYRSLGKLMTSEQVIELNALSRNSMTWADDRAAAAFVSPRDASASSFAKQVKSIVQDELVAGKPENLQYGAAIFATLKAYGMNYVIDPSSAFTDNVGTSSVDFLQFPYQTLLYHGGDCDDLTILNCALFEALGIDTAMITVPGHILMAFDSGLSVAEKDKVSDGYYIVQDDKVWIPLEITLCQDSYALEKQTAYREWTKYKKERALIPLKEAWKEFAAVGIPDSDVKIQMPTRAKIISGFKTHNK